MNIIDELNCFFTGGSPYNMVSFAIGVVKIRQLYWIRIQAIQYI